MTPWTTIAGWTIVHFLWQGAFIGGTAAIGLALLRAATPHARYVLATAALALMLLSPLVTATWLSSASRPPKPGSPFAPRTVAVVDPSTLGGSASAPIAVHPNAAPFGLDRLFPMIVSLWAAGVVLLFLRLLGGWWRVRRLQREALATPASRWQAVTHRMAERLRLRCGVHVVESSVVTTPAIIGWWRPVLLLPLTGLAGLTPGQAEAIVAHELVHVRRHDYLVNVFQRVTETVLFYHPAVWWISHRMRIEREQCCDAVVVRVCGDAAGYAAALLHLEEGRADEPALAVAANGGALVDRIRRILRPPPGDRRPLAPAVVTAGTVLLLVLIVSGGYHRPFRTLQALGRTSAADSLIATVNGEPVKNADPQRAYADGLAARAPKAQGGTLVPGQPTTAAPDWHITAAGHFDIYATPDVAAHVERAERVAERAYQHVSADLALDLDTRPAVVLVRTGASARAVERVPNRPGSGRMLLPVDLTDGDLLATVTHEMTHLFEVNVLSKAVMNSAPDWIVEGLSEYEGGVWATSDQAMLRQLVRSNVPPALTTLDATLRQANPRLPYSLGHAAFDFITARWGVGGIRRLLMVLENGSVDRQTLYMTAWGLSNDDLDRDFTAYLRAQFPAQAAAALPELPKCMRDAGLTNVDLRDVTLPQVLAFLAGTCGVNVRVEGIPDSETSRIVPRVQFSQATLSDVFRMVVTSAGWRYTVVDEKTVVLAPNR